MQGMFLEDFGQVLFRYQSHSICGRCLLIVRPISSITFTYTMPTRSFSLFVSQLVRTSQGAFVKRSNVLPWQGRAFFSYYFSYGLVCITLLHSYLVSLYVTTFFLYKVLSVCQFVHRRVSRSNALLWQGTALPSYYFVVWFITC